MHSPAPMPSQSLHRPLYTDICQTRSLPLRPKLLDGEISFFLRKGQVVCFSLLSAQCPGGGSLLSTISLMVTITQESKPLRPPEPGDKGVSPAWQLQKVRSPDTKPRAPDVCKISPWVTLGQRWQPLAGARHKGSTKMAKNT